MNEIVSNIFQIIVHACSSNNGYSYAYVIAVIVFHQNLAHIMMSDGNPKYTKTSYLKN